MIRNLSSILLASLLIGSFSPVAQATKSTLPKSRCEADLIDDGKPTWSIIESGRDQDVQEQVRAAVAELFDPGGIIEQLGMVPPKQVLEFVQGQELDYLAGTGRHPVAHATEGAEILKMLQSGGVVYEFVAPGRDYQHSYYRDTMTAAQQISIVMHVAGHMHFTQVTAFEQERAANLLVESKELNDLLLQLYRTQDHTEVAEWYYYLKSLAHDQDLVRGTSEKPEDFVLDRRSVADGIRHPRSTTANILQAFVENLPIETPEWKRDVARRFERLVRFYSGSTISKIQNEGWASLFQEILVEHSTIGEAFPDAMEVAKMMEGVTYPDLGNPYWLGREAWRNLRKKFNLREEVQKLSPIERDKAFIAWAVDEVFSRGMDDYTFLSFALDKSWVLDRNLAILTHLENYQDWDHSIPEPTEEEMRRGYDDQWKIASRDTDTIIRQIQRQSADLRSMIPRVLLKNLNHQGENRVLLGFDEHDLFGNGIPLEPRSMVQKLSIFSQMLKKEITIETLASSVWFEEAPDPDVYYSYYGRPLAPVKTWPMRVNVSPKGRVRVELIGDSESETAQRQAELEEFLQAEVDRFRDDLRMSRSPTFDQKQDRYYRQMVGQLTTHSIGGINSSFFDHIPTAAGALVEYQKEVSSRMVRALDRFMKGEEDVVRTQKGIKIRALVPVPSFRFDGLTQERLKNDARNDGRQNYDDDFIYMRSPATRSQKGVVRALKERSRASLAIRGDHSLTRRRGENPFNKQDSDVLTEFPTGGQEGDHFWGPNPNEGNGNGNRGPGESGSQPGDGAMDPSWVEIPFDLYGETLSQVIELPRLQPKHGESLSTRRVRSGRRLREDGYDLESLTAERAYEIGVALDRSERRANPKRPKRNRKQLMQLGLRNLDVDEDWFVKSRADEPLPEFNAVVVFLLDMSSSMPDWAVDNGKKLAFDLRAILEQKYKQVEFRYIAFDSASNIFSSAEEFFKARLGGGTSYAEGYKGVLKVFKKHPRSKWDRYVVGVGDLGDFGPQETIEVVDQVRRESEFGAFASVAEIGKEELGEYFRELSRIDPYFGFADMGHTDNYSPLILQELFKQKKE